MKLPIVAAFVLTAVTAPAASHAQSFNVQAARTTAFLDSIGVNIHLESQWDTAYSDQANGGTAWFGSDPAAGAVIINGRTYTNVSKIVAALRYTGITHARVSLPGDYVADRLQALTQAIPTLKIDLLTSTADTIWNEVIVRGGKIIGQLDAIEGLNEATVTARYQGLSGVPADCRFQSTLYGTVQYLNNSHGTHVPVLAPSGNGNWNDFAALSVCAWAAHAGNGHLYSDANPPTWQVQYDLPYDRKDAPAGSPVWGTEAGMSTNAAAPRGMNEDVAAKRTISELLSYFSNRIVRTYLYEAVDENPQTPKLNDNWNSNEMEMHYGLFRNDWSAKETAQMLHAQSVLLADTGSNAWSFVPQALSFTLANAPPSTYTALMQKSSGTFVLALWPEPQTMWVPATNTNWGWQTTIPATRVQVGFGRAFSSIQIADPFAAGGVQGSAVPYASSISVSLTDHPVYLVLKP